MSTPESPRALARQAYTLLGEGRSDAAMETAAKAYNLAVRELAVAATYAANSGLSAFGDPDLRWALGSLERADAALEAVGWATN